MIAGMNVAFIDIAENSWTIIKMRKPEGKPFQKILEPESRRLEIEN